MSLVPVALVAKSAACSARESELPDDNDLTCNGQRARL